MTNEIVLSASALSVEQVVQQRDLIKSTMKSAMEEGMHYGRVPGCGEKPSLMQPGAQLLGYLFKVRPEYDIQEKDFENDHREYRIICKLFHQPTGAEVGQGVGICSTKESKYRYRNAAAEITWLDEPVPNIYWTLRRKSKEEMDKWLQTLFEGRDISIIGTKKDEKGQWRFVEYHGGEGKVDNPNIVDTFNTVLKICKKRAYVDAIITATASNDLFTQDLEDIADNLKTVDTIISTASEVKKVTPKESSPISDIQEWKKVRVHFGKAGGPVKDRELGSLSQTTIQWLNEQMAKKTNPTKQDNILIAALAIEAASNSSEGNKNGASLELLRAKCEAMKIPIQVIAKVSKTTGGEAEHFDDITEEQAKYLLDNWEDTLACAMDESDNIPM